MKRKTDGTLTSSEFVDFITILSDAVSYIETVDSRSDIYYAIMTCIIEINKKIDNGEISTELREMLGAGLEIIYDWATETWDKWEEENGRTK